MRSTLEIGPFGRPFGLGQRLNHWAPLVGLLLLEACSPHESNVAPAGEGTPLIAFLSTVAEVQDSSYRSFLQAWASVASGRCANARVQHFASENDQPPAQVANARAAAALSPAVVIAPTEGNARAARAASDQPIVFATFLNPVKARLVSSEGPHPENATGISLDDRLLAKRLEILREAFPWVRKVGLVVDDAWRIDSDMDKVLEEVHRASGLTFYVGSAETPEAVPALFRAMDAKDVDAWHIPPTYVGYLAEAQILQHLKTVKTPAIHSTLGEVQHGGLMAYSQDTSFAYTSMASLANRICNGERAGSIPIERPTRFILSVRANYDLGDRHVAPSIIARADKIE